MSNSRFGLRTRNGLVRDIIIRDKKYLLNSYPGAIGAYSLRLLRENYTGSAIRVRRSNDNAEQDIGFTSDGDLDTAALLSFVGANNGFVTTWYNQSGSTIINLTQTTAANQPQIVSSGNVILENGKPIILFNGTSHALNAPGRIIINDFSVYGVAKKPSTSNNGVLFTIYDTFAADRTLFYMENPPDRIIGIQIGTSSAKTGTPTFTQKLYYYDRNGSNIEYADNDSNVTNFTNSTTIQNAPLRLGAFGTPALQYLEQNIQEIILYMESNTSNRAGISANINEYYNIY